MFMADFATNINVSKNLHESEKRKFMVKTTLAHVLDKSALYGKGIFPARIESQDAQFLIF